MDICMWFQHQMLCRYGPFWICTTLIFVAAAIGTFVTYVAHKVKSQEWTYDINVVQWSAGLFYGYVTVVPLLLYVILKYFSAPAGLVQLFCLYGYSLFVFIPALVSPWRYLCIKLITRNMLRNVCMSQKAYANTQALLRYFVDFENMGQNFLHIKILCGKVFSFLRMLEKLT